MLVFPQLSSGGNAQYPLRRTAAARTVVNTLQDGTTVKFEDISAALIRWELPLESLDEVERAAIEELFVAAEGELNAFTLLDPGTNLLAWSEDFSKSAWVADPLLGAVGSGADPLGGTAAWQLTNTGLASQQIAQTIQGPAQFEYCFSAYVRGTGNVSLVLSSGTANNTRTFALSSSWQRVSAAGQLGSTGVTVQAAIALGPEATVQVFGLQLEAQPAAGHYRRSLGGGGVFSQVRFESGSFSTVAVGLDRNSTVIRLVTSE